MKKYKKKNKCRNCNSSNIKQILNLGNLAFTGKFLEKGNLVPKTPLELAMCSQCKLVQLIHDYDNNYIYGYDYGYQSNINSIMKNHLIKIVNTINRKFKIKKNDIFIDIGSNDGTLLNHKILKKCITVGFDPIIKRLKKNYKNINFKINKFFNFKNFKKFKIGNEKFITAIAMFYDLKDPNNFLCEIKKILDEDGVFILEQSDLRLMLKKNSFDTICHEHLEYYSIKIIKEMLEKNNLKIFDHEYNESNGGSSRFYICHKENYRHKITIKLKKAIDLENKSKIDNIDTLKKFEKRINKLKKTILHIINIYKKKGPIHGYGASTKGNVLLQYFKLDRKTIKCIADRNPFKWGKYTPGTNIKIISEKTSRLQKPKLYIVLPWHFKNEIIKREKIFLKNKGTLFFPLPKCEIIKMDKK